MAFRTTYMNDYKWLPSKLIGANGLCCKYYSQSPPVNSKPKREEYELYPYRQSVSRYESCDGNCYDRNISNPYNNLHCSCHECQRYISYHEHKLKQNYPITSTSTDDRQPDFYNKMVQKNRFKTTYKDSYNKKYSHPEYNKYHTIKCPPVREDDFCYPIQMSQIYPKPQSKRRISLENGPAYQTGARKYEKGGGMSGKSWHTEYKDGISKTGKRIMMEKLLINIP